MSFRAINSYNVGSVVDIDNIPHLQGVKIDAITMSCVYVKGNTIPGGVTTVSGGSMAIPARYKAIDNEVKNIAKDNTDNSEEKKPRAKRGSLTKLMENIKLPKKQFTIAELAEYNKIPVPYALKWVKDNCIECGKANKEPGTRGRAATIYTK